MATLTIRADLLERLEALAARENQDVNTLAELVLEAVLGKQAPDGGEETEANPFAALIGMITPEDTQETDLSLRVSEIMR